jgi:hypothetical protein
LSGQAPERELARGERVASARGVFQQRCGALDVSALEERLRLLNCVVHGHLLAAKTRPFQKAVGAKKEPGVSSRLSKLAND